MPKGKYKLPLDVGFAALCDHIKAIKKTADSSESAVFALVDALDQFVEEVVDVLNGKPDISEVVPFIIPTEGWVPDNSFAGYWYCLDFEVADLTEHDIVKVIVWPGSEKVARAANFMQTQSLEGKFRLRCTTIPTAEIEAEYHVTDATVNDDDLAIGTSTE